MMDVRTKSVDIDPGWYVGQPETADTVAEDTAAPSEEASSTASHVPTVLTKLQKWGDYASFGEPVFPSRFIPMKTPLSQEILDCWQLAQQPKHRLTVEDLLAAQTAAGRHVGLILDLSNHDCLYTPDIPPSIDYLHVQLVAKELPPLEFVREVGRAANQFWSQHSSDYIAIHCAYGFNRTGFVVCSYLVENCGLSVEQALQSFARSRPPGVKHEKFRDELHARYGSMNQAMPRPISSSSAAAAAAAGELVAVCGASSSSSISSSSAAFSSNNSSAGQAGFVAPLPAQLLQLPQQQRLPQQQQRLQAVPVAAAASADGQCSSLSECSSSSTVQAWGCHPAESSTYNRQVEQQPAAPPADPCAAAETVTSANSGRERQQAICSAEQAAAAAGTGTGAAVAAADGVEEARRSMQRPPAPPQLIPGSASTTCPGSYQAYLPSSPLPASSLPARCYSSGSVGDNSSIGCSPDSVVDLIINGGSNHSTNSSSALGSQQGFGASCDLPGQQQQQQQRGQGSPGPLWPCSSRAGPQQQQQQQQQGQQQGLSPSRLERTTHPSSFTSTHTWCAGTAGVGGAAAATAAAAAAAARCADGGCGSEGADEDAAECGVGTDEGMAGTDEGLEVFEMDPPCGDAASWMSGSRSRLGCDGLACCVQQQQLQLHAAELSGLMETVHLGEQQLQQQQQEARPASHGTSSQQPGQQMNYGPPGAVAGAAGGAVGCSCSCHTADRSSSSCGAGEAAAAAAGGGRGGRGRHSRLQDRRELSSEGSGFGVVSGSHELLDNESFGKVTSADLLKSLRGLQQNHEGS